MSADAPPQGSLLLLGRPESMFFHSIFYVSFVHPFADTRDICMPPFYKIILYASMTHGTSSIKVACHARKWRYAVRK